MVDLMLVCCTAVLLLLQGARREGGDGGAQERPGHPRHAPLGGSVPQHQAREHSGRRPGQVSPHGMIMFIRLMPVRN